MLCFGENDKIYGGRSVNEVVESQNVVLEKKDIGYLYFIYMNASVMQVYSFHRIREKMLLLDTAGAFTCRPFIMHLPPGNDVGVP